MAKFLALFILAASSAAGFRFGPSVKYMVFGSNRLSEVEGVSYEESSTTILFNESALFLPGLVIEVPLADGWKADLGFHRSGYDPAYVILPDTSEHQLNRSGNIPVFELGLSREIGAYHLAPALELHRCSEKWSNPNDGAIESLDSTAVGPSISLGTEMELPFFSPKFEMGLVFPALSDVQGKVELSALVP